MQSSFTDLNAEVRRSYQAAPDLIFAAFADPALVRLWLKPGPDVSLDVLIYEFRPGGRYRFAYRTPGFPLMHVNGVFDVIDAPSRIVFGWNIEPPDEHAGIRSEVRVAITPVDSGSEVFIQHVNLSRPDAPRRHAEGWLGALGGLELLLARSSDGA
ncbi:MAG: SRPBCC domain-containing protein [Hyphomonadaceae bacterium]